VFRNYLKVEKKFFKLLIVILLSVSCSSHTQPQPEHKPGPKRMVEEITLERSICFGECPSYKVTLRRDGSANYVGEFYVKRKGVYKGEISEAQFNRLVRLLESQDFFQMTDKYPDDLEKLVDGQVNQLSVKSVAGNKIIRYHHHDEPVELWAIELAIDAVTEELNRQKEK
jgi:hypothetical protein